MSRVIVVMAMLVLCGVPADARESWLGPEALWRCRETLVFHLYDDRGDGFSLDVDLRDMNIYQQGERPVLLWVTGPGGNTLVRQVVEDDGNVDGGGAFCDGISDVYLDFRYREWHRANSPRGVPPGKKRSPYLRRPQELEARRVPLQVPPLGKGLYRLVIVAGWDHWVAVTPSRRLRVGVHSGPGPMPVHGERLEEAYLYVPATTKELGIVLTEEEAPYNWRLQVEDDEGRQLAATEPRTFCSYAFVREPAHDSVLRLRVTGTTPGACLHLKGAPFLLCPDAETARLMHGGVEVDEFGRATFHEYLRTLTDWAYSLERSDLAVDVSVPDPSLPLPFPSGGNQITLGDVAMMLESQDLDPASPGFGRFDIPDGTVKEALSFWRQAVDVIAGTAGWDDPANPYAGHPALVRRVLVHRLFANLMTQAPYFWYEHSEGGQTFAVQKSQLFSIPIRSNWYPMHDGMHAKSLEPIREMVPYALPARCASAWELSLSNWAISRTVMHQGECSNQWAAGLSGMKDVWAATRNPVVEEVLERQVERYTTPGNLGRVNPDPTPFDGKSTVAHGGRAADSGLTGGGVVADGLGHDNEYCLESTLHMGHIWEAMPHPGIARWLNEYYVLKTHLTLPKSGDWPTDAFHGTCSPTDFNHRTCCYTHKSPLGALRSEIVYGDLWAGQRNDERPWPCMEEEPFTRVIDNQFFFVRTPAYYTILYGGMASPEFSNWCYADVGDGSAQLVGYTGMHYTGTQRSATKIGGISAVWVPGCGPVWLGQNLNVMFSNTVWGRRTTPVSTMTQRGHVDPYIICSGFGTPEVQWDAATRRMVRTQTLRYAPVTVRRDIDLRDDRIQVSVVVTATGDVTLKELYEALPFYAQDRTITLYDEEFENATELPVPEPATSSRTWQVDHQPGDPRTGENPDLAPVSFQAYDVAAASGAGALIVLDRKAEATRTHPVRYRSVAAPTAGFNVVLPATLEKGQTVALRYAIIPHSGILSPTTARDLAQAQTLLWE